MAFAMYDDPYLETCCRAALHRLFLAGAAGRPVTQKDAPCLHRVTGMGLACEVAPERFVLTQAGAARHASEVLKQTSPGRARS